MPIQTITSSCRMRRYIQEKAGQGEEAADHITGSRSCYIEDYTQVNTIVNHYLFTNPKCKLNTFLKKRSSYYLHNYNLNGLELTRV